MSEIISLLPFSASYLCVEKLVAFFFALVIFFFIFHCLGISRHEPPAVSLPSPSRPNPHPWDLPFPPPTKKEKGKKLIFIAVYSLEHNQTPCGQLLKEKEILPQPCPHLSTPPPLTYFVSLETISQQGHWSSGSSNVFCNVP